MEQNFFKVNKELLRKFKGDATPVMILQNMQEFATNDKVAFNISRFSEDTGMSRNKVARGIDKLLAAGVCSKTEQHSIYKKAIYVLNGTDMLRNEATKCSKMKHNDAPKRSNQHKEIPKEITKEIIKKKKSLTLDNVINGGTYNIVINDKKYYDLKPQQVRQAITSGYTVYELK